MTTMSSRESGVRALREGWLSLASEASGASATGCTEHLSHGEHARMARYPKVKDRWEGRDWFFRTVLVNDDHASISGPFSPMPSVSRPSS